MATQAQFPAPTLPNRHSFFESFPRELRDKVYTELSEEVVLLRNALRYRMSIPLVAFRLVNRQSKLEYDEIYPQNMHMSRFALICHRNAGTSARMHEVARATRSITLTVEMNTCWGPECHRAIARKETKERATLYARIFSGFVQDMTHLRSSRAIMTAGHQKCFYEILEAIEHFVTQPKLVELVILRPRWSIDDNGDYKALATWTEHNGLIHDHEAIKQLL